MVPAKRLGQEADKGPDKQAADKELVEVPEGLVTGRVF